MREAVAIEIICAFLGGEPEVTHGYDTDMSPHHIRVDCESPGFVMEVGLDKRSSFDSLHQVLFAAELTGKTPKIVMIDTDLRERQYEHQIRTTAERAGVIYQSFYLGDIVGLCERPEVREQFEACATQGPGK